MVNYLSLEEALRLHDASLKKYGGLSGIRDQGVIESAVAQPAMALFGSESYPTLFAKATALGYSLIKNHGFVDGNKRVGLLSIVLFLQKNGYLLQGGGVETYEAIRSVAAGEWNRDDLQQWIETHTVPFSP